MLIENTLQRKFCKKWFPQKDGSLKKIMKYVINYLCWKINRIVKIQNDNILGGSI